MSLIRLTAHNPNEVRLVSISDPHLCEFSPPSWKADYRTTLESTLQQVFNFAITQQVDAILWPGDLFHLKSASRHSIRFMTECIRMLKAVGIPHFVTAGNHDQRFGSNESIVGQPLENLAVAGAVTILDGNEVYIEAPNAVVQLAGASYSHGDAAAVRDLKRGSLYQNNGDVHLIGLGHFWYGIQNGIFHGEPVFSPAYLGKSAVDTYLIGHHHYDRGIFTDDVTQKTYVNCGSISLIGERPQSTRRPAAAYLIIRPVGSGMQPKVYSQILRPKVPLISELVDVERYEIEHESDAALTNFIDSLGSTSTAAVEPREILAGMDVSTEVKTKAGYYLETAQAGKSQ